MTLKVFYSPHYNIDLGFLNRLHPFDGTKFQKVAEKIRDLDGVEMCQPQAPVSDTEINSFVDALQALVLKKKGYIMRALEVPKIPLIPFSWLDKKILLPMRWAVAGTEAAAISALEGQNSWNLSGGYHHASRNASEGFCIYNDIGIAIQQLREKGTLSADAKILIIDIDAHHGNGNAYVFMDDPMVTLFDIYNGQNYPDNKFTRARVDIDLPLRATTKGPEYLQQLEQGLQKIDSDYSIAFIVAGTDVLSTDPLGGLQLTIAECVERDALVAKSLLSLSVPFVFLGGGGYSVASAQTMISGISRVADS